LFFYANAQCSIHFRGDVAIGLNYDK